MKLAIKPRINRREEKLNEQFVPRFGPSEGLRGKSHVKLVLPTPLRRRGVGGEGSGDEEDAYWFAAASAPLPRRGEGRKPTAMALAAKSSIVPR
jgi:hypothetical protein